MTAHDPSARRPLNKPLSSYTSRVTRPLLRYVDLFAGAGGLSEGFSRVGRFRAVASVELDRFAAATYSANHPRVPVFAGDIAAWLSGDVPTADVVLGGPPCQGFSNLGTRRVRDPRNALWRRYVDALTEIRPMYFVLENVANFLESGQFKSLSNATRPSGRLKDYRIEPWILNAADFGVPQVRKRAIVIGSLRDLPSLGMPTGHLSGRESEWRTVREVIGDLDFLVPQINLPDSHMVFEGRRIPGPFKSIELHLGRTPTARSLERYRSIPPGGNRKDLPDHLLAPCWRNHHSGSGDVMGRLHWDRPSVTIRTEFWKPEKGRYLHPQANRPLTHLEGARLQGFPDDYLWCGPKSEIGRQIGNAVPVELAAGIASHLFGQFVS
jgi:DNA (cytosine-5)-methyltransferase 1